MCVVLFLERTIGMKRERREREEREKSK